MLTLTFAAHPYLTGRSIKEFRLKTDLKVPKLEVLTSWKCKSNNAKVKLAEWIYRGLLHDKYNLLRRLPVWGSNL